MSRRLGQLRQKRNVGEAHPFGHTSELYQNIEGLVERLEIIVIDLADLLDRAELARWYRAADLVAAILDCDGRFTDEPHLVGRGLRNWWGYNPVAYFAIDPRLAPLLKLR